MVKAIERKPVRLSRRERYDTLCGYLFISPYIIGFLVFTLIPVFYSFYLSFTEYNVLSSPEFIGIGNYVKMFTQDTKFWKSFAVTWKFTLVGVPVKLLFSLLVATVLAKETKLTNFYRVALYIPSLLGGSVAVAITWKQLWNTKGVINSIMELLGLTPINWLHNTDTALYILILLGVWQFGQQMLVFLSGIKNIPSSLYEAAIIDGAGPVMRYLKITIPMLTPSIFFNLINGIIGSLQAFNSAFLVTAGGPMGSTLLYGLHQYQQAFQYRNMGYACAMAWFLMLIIVALTALIFRSSSGWVYYEDESR